MAKTKTQKELLAKVSSSSLAYNYDLTVVDPREYAAPLQMLFLSADWKDIFIRRNKLFRAAMNADQNAFKQIEQIDRKVANLLLQTMFRFSQSRSEVVEGKTISLHQYFSDFVRTPEQHEIYREFSLNIDTAVLLADVLDSIMVNCKDLLHKLDPSMVLSEFDSINTATKALSDFSHLHHRDENFELASMFADVAEEIEEYLRMKAAVFYKKYKEKEASLINEGSIKYPSSKKHSDKEYLINLLENYYYICGDSKGKATESKNKAQRAIKEFSEDEYEQLMPVIADLYNQSQAIHMANDRIATILGTLPANDISQKIAQHIL